MDIIEECYDNWDERERFWISYYRMIGENICNLTDGGEGILGCKKSEETRKKISLNNARGRSKRVYQFSKKGEFIRSYISAAEAAIKNNTEKGFVTKCARGEQYTGGGYHWSYNNTFTIKPRRKYYGKRTDIHSR